ncbi:MAG: hypothetical protein EOO07_36125 [Chitinophagaceae bacterium]|nr:MAG: hypothetical protein EOO07_36125 [Chitinophagaceae bacterium]
MAYNGKVLAKAGIAWFLNRLGIDVRFCQYDVSRRFIAADLAVLATTQPAVVSIVRVRPSYRKELRK